MLFDLDGTLIDSGPMILASFRHATQTVLAREIADEHLLAHVGGSSLRAQMSVIDPDRVDDLVRAYRAHNEQLHDRLCAFPGIEDALRRLVDDGRTLGIVTAKRRSTVDLALAVLPLAPYFDVIVTSDQCRRHKPDPEPLRIALERLGGSPATSAYVGDSPFDVQAAKAAGMLAVAVGWGGIHSLERLRAEEPDVVVESVEELVGVL